jgi:N-carbamoyl-L-amino-acid hydrolase
LEVVVDRAGNQWGWWGNPDETPGVVIGSHLDSVADGGAFDGPLGVVSAFAALDALQHNGFAHSVPIGVANFADEEGARFGIACAGSRLLTGALDPRRAAALRDADGVTMAEAWRAAGLEPNTMGADPEALRRVTAYVELHVEQGLALALDPDGEPDLIDPARAVAIGTEIWPHGRWEIDLFGEANHAGTTRLEDRLDAMLQFAAVVASARMHAREAGCLATIGKVLARPNAVNAIADHVTCWLDARGAPTVTPCAALSTRSAPRSTKTRALSTNSRGLPRRRSTARCAIASPVSCRMRPCWRPAPATTPASSPTPASPPRCCSSATRPASRTRRPSGPSRRTVTEGWPPWPMSCVSSLDDPLLVV